MRQREGNRPAELKGRWLLTFNDMMTLLFAFFVLIISMSQLETSKIKGVAASVRDMLGMKEAPKVVKTGIIEPFMLPWRDEDIDRERIINGGGSLRGGLPEKKAALSQSFRRIKGLKILPLRDGLSVSMEEPLLFTPGAAEVVEKGYPFLNALAENLQRTDVSIRVEGHTDDLEMATGKYPSNWELSMTRAANIVKHLVFRGGISPERLSAAGYAASRPKAPNVNPQNRQLNRRVDIILTFPEN